MSDSSFGNDLKTAMMMIHSQSCMVPSKYTRHHGPHDPLSLAVAVFSTLLASGWTESYNPLLVHSALSS
jgi:hypothetical protein